MKHIQAVTKVKFVPAKAQDTLAKTAQLNVAAQAITLFGQVMDLFKGEETQA